MNDFSNYEEKFNEYLNLNGFYLKVLLEGHQISLICFNSNSLDGIKYEKKINMDEINKNDKIRNLSISELYDVIIKKINGQKFSIFEENNYIKLSIFKGNNPNLNNDLHFILIKSFQYPKNEFEKVLANSILSLREENNNLRNEINQIKNILSKLNGGKELIFNAPENSLKLTTKTDIKLKAKKKTNQDISHNPIQNPENNKNDSNKDLNIDVNDAHIMNITEIKKRDLTPNMNKAKVLIPKIDFPKNLKNKSQIPVKDMKESLTISSLSNLKYGCYPPVELSSNSFCKISGYGANSYNGIVRNYNEDKIKVILDYKLQKSVKGANGNELHPNISFFGIYDGHGGNNCSEFLQENFHKFLFESDYFPLYTLQAINEAYSTAEEEFKKKAYDPKSGKLLDKSGSCSITTLIIDEWCFISYLGDSRGIFSFDSGNQFYQITRDHKPNDPIEKERIEKVGGSVYKDNRVKINGQKIHVKEETLAPGVTFPYRVSPGNLAVIIFFKYFIFYFLFIGCKSIGRFWNKNSFFGGKNWYYYFKTLCKYI